MSTPPSPFDKLPPHSIEAEMCALASLMLCGSERATFAKIRRRLWPAAFYQPDHQTIFEALCRMADAGDPVDAVTLSAELERAGMLAEVGGVAYLGQLLSAVPSWHHGEHYAAIVAERARERDAIAACHLLISRLMQPAGDRTSSEVISRAIADLWRLSAQGRELTVGRLAAALERFVDAKEQRASQSVAAGWRDLDAGYLGVLALGDYTLLGARPSMGKSTWLRNLLLNKARAGVPVGLVAVEEREGKIAGNAISNDAGILNHHVAYGEWDPAAWNQVMESVGRLSGLPFYLTDSALNLEDVVAAVEMLATQHGCKIIGVDHVHLIEGPSRETREQQLSQISAALKQAIKRLGFAGIVAAQLSRPAERVGIPPSPRLIDLRGSGALEEHADSVLFLHRRDYYRPAGSSDLDGLTEVIIAKNRNGPRGNLYLRSDLERQRFLDCETSPENPFDGEAL